MKNILIKGAHPEKGTHYFTNRYKAATWAGVNYAAVSACIAGSVRKDGINFEAVDGSDIKYKDID